MRVVGEKSIALHVCWIEFPLPAGIAEAGDSHIGILGHTLHSFYDRPHTEKLSSHVVDTRATETANELLVFEKCAVAGI